MDVLRSSFVHATLNSPSVRIGHHFFPLLCQKICKNFIKIFHQNLFEIQKFFTNAASVMMGAYMFFLPVSSC
jgi:hypothetical protein